MIFIIFIIFYQFNRFIIARFDQIQLEKTDPVSPSNVLNQILFVSIFLQYRSSFFAKYRNSCHSYSTSKTFYFPAIVFLFKPRNGFAYL